MYTCASFFAGVGGIDLGFENTGMFKTVYANEIDKYPVETFELNFPIKVDNRSICDVKPEEVPDVDVIMGGFPCLTADSMVLTADGYKRIVDVTDNDKVLSHDGKYHRVLNFMDQGIKEVYSIKSYGFDEIRATGNHRFYVREKRRVWDNEKRSTRRVFDNPEWKTVDSIKNNYKDYYFGSPINNEKKLPKWNGIEVFVNQTTTTVLNNLDLTSKDFWYLVGRYVGDGWLRKQQKDGDKRYKYNGIVICCGKEKFNEFFSRIPENLHYTFTEERTAYKFIFSNVELASFLTNFGVGAANKRIPGFVLDLPVSLLKEFINGMCDTDGDIVNDRINLKYNYTTVSRELTFGLMHCVEKVYHVPCRVQKTIRPKTYVIEGRTVNQKDSYRVTFEIGENKKRHAFYENGYVWYPIKSLDKCEDKENVYDIEVEDSHSFIVNHTTSHNCQSFSIAGYRQGFNDEKGRGNMFFELLRIIEVKRPRIAFFENVKNLMGHDGGNTFRIIFDSLCDIGYHVEFKVMNATEYGNIPQNRERIYIIAFRDKDDFRKFILPDKIERTKNIWDCIDFVNKVDDKYYYTPGKYKGDIYNKLVEAMEHDNFDVYQWRRQYVRKNKSGVVPTLTANCGEGGHNVPIIKTDFGIRKLTPRECFNVQGYPSEFKLPDQSGSKLYKQAGNSVVVPVITRIAEQILKAIE